MFDPLLYEFVPGIIHLEGEVGVHLVDVGALAEVLELEAEFTEVVGVLAVLLRSQSSWTSNISISIRHIERNILNRRAHRKQKEDAS